MSLHATSLSFSLHILYWHTDWESTTMDLQIVLITKKIPA